MRAATLDGPAHRFISWNVAGMRALMKKDAESLRRLVEAEQLDAVCLQVGAVCWYWPSGRDREGQGLMGHGNRTVRRPTAGRRCDGTRVQLQPANLR